MPYMSPELKESNKIKRYLNSNETRRSPEGRQRELERKKKAYAATKEFNRLKKLGGLCI
jgi:hypothetical protein